MRSKRLEQYVDCERVSCGFVNHIEAGKLFIRLRCRQKTRWSAHTDVTSDKNVASRTCLEHFSLPLVYVQPGPFAEPKITERNSSELSERNGGQKN